VIMIDGLDNVQIPPSGAKVQPYWDGAKAGKLLLPKCRDCGKIHWYPRALCPFCLSNEIDWQPASGRGTIFSFSIMRVKNPYVIAYVRLEEGVTMMTNIIDCELDRLAIGQNVRVEFTIRAATPVPVFKPA
jgi:uncharacterized OB-fold protein